MTDVCRKLKAIDWEFSDYRGLFTSYADINSLHWYPAPFVPQIPAILIELLSNETDTVLDPFAGGGAALLEAARLNRRFVGVDRNPHAVDIINAKILALDVITELWLTKLLGTIKDPMPRADLRAYVRDNGIHEDVFRWFHSSTLTDLCRLHATVVSIRDCEERLVAQTLFSSILLKACARQEHYTYITDNCFPDLSQAVRKDAVRSFVDQAHLALESATQFRIQYNMMHGRKWQRRSDKVFKADSRNLDFLRSGSVDMVVTSPPYVGVNDYVRSMRLTTLFFPNPDVDSAILDEIGARRKRSRRHALEEYVADMDAVFAELARVLKRDGYMAMVIGQGRGKVTKSENVTEGLLNSLSGKYGFRIIHREKRKIKFRRIQVPGIGSEEVVVCKRE